MIGYAVHDGVAIVTIDNPPVNALGPGVLDGIADAIARGVADPSAGAIVLIGAGRTFVAGADINIFKTLRTREQALERSGAMHARLRQIENASKPVVAAIHGTAFGGGLELSMACHFRIATADAQIGQPEVHLGIIPGAGGTQRLPRLCGVPLALTMCTDGQPIAAAAAHAAGIIDAVVPRGNDLLEDAVAFARGRAAAHTTRRTRDLTDMLADTGAAVAACDERRTALTRTLRHNPAPLAAVDAVRGACTLTFDAGSILERELSADLVISRESRAFVHLFLAEREAAKIPGVPKDTPAQPIERAAVIGAGTMGAGIAMVYANAGIPVLLKDVDAAALDRGLATIRRNYESSVAKGKMSPEVRDRALARIAPTTTFDQFGGVDIVVEAVFEDMPLKKATFAELGRATKAGCILASNTSSLDIDAFSRASGRAATVVGHHFFSPANVMKLLEIVRGKETSAETIATSLTLAKQLGKVGVVVGNCPGFVANRMLAYYMREACLLLEEGSSVQQIDHAMTEFGMPVGPFAMQDIAGIDVGARIMQQLKTIGKTRAEGPQSEVPDLLYEMGRYGQKTGAGWYTYEPGSRAPVPDPIVATLVDEAARRRGLRRRIVSDEEIVTRMTTALANEGARILEDGSATRPGDIDVIYCYGFGYPRHLGGPMFHADTVGLPRVLASLHEYLARFGDYWRPAPLIERLVAEGRGFYDDLR